MRIEMSRNEALVQDIKERKRQNGGYCPCTLQKNEDTKCMCKAFRDQADAKQPGECHCGLYKIVLDDEDAH